MKAVKDDWGTALGEDHQPTATVRTPKKLTASSLVYFFQNNLPVNYVVKMNAPVNAKALMKAFRKCTDNGFSLEQVKEMITLFMDDIARKPLPADIQPWRGFVANLDSLAKRITKEITGEEYDGWSVDSRLTNRA